MTYSGQKRACSTVALICLLLSCAAAAPAKLDHLGAHSSVSHHSRGGFRAGHRDTGIWGANLDRPNNLSPPRWGSNALETEVETVDHHDHRGGSGTGTVLNENFGAKAFNTPQFNAQVFPQFGASSNLNTFVSSNFLQQGYLPPAPSAPEPQGYNYRAPQTPVNLYQPPPPPRTTSTTTTTTTTTRRPPPPPPSGLYDLPISTNYRPVPVRVQPAPARTPAPFRAPVTQPPPPQRPPTPPTGLYELPLASHPVVQRQPLHQHQPPKPQPDMPAMPYEFAYGVNDANSGNHYAREERHDGNVMRGQYSVLLPDGRTQVVKYYDDGSGFNAEVTYH